MTTIGLTSFVIGLVLLLAALLGTGIKIVQVDLPKFEKRQRVIAGFMGTVLVIFGLMGGELPKPPANTGTSTPSPSIADPAVAGTPRLNLDEGKPLPDAIRTRSSSVQVEFGCVWLFESPKYDQPQLHVCADTPSLPQEWRNRARRVAPDCSSVAQDRILVHVWQEENYAGDHWEYGFGC